MSAYDIVPGKRIDSKLLYIKDEKFLYAIVNKVKSGQRYRCIEQNCAAGVTVCDGQIKRSKNNHINHSDHEAKMKEYSAMHSLKGKCQSVEELFSNKSVSTKAVYEKHLSR